jgi:hypothetical protein
MGTLYPYEVQSKKDLIHFINAQCQHENDMFSLRVLKSCVRGNVLWQVLESRNKDNGNVERFIVCNLLTAYEGRWGYKDMTENMGPYYYSCPLGYLKLTESGKHVHREWREGVRRYHEKRTPPDKIVEGGEYTLRNCNLSGCTVKISSVKPLVGRVGGYPYRLKREYVGPRKKD